MKFYEQFPENRAKSGIGCALYSKNATGKFSIVLPLETVPVASAAAGSIDIDVTTVPFIGKIEGKASLDEKESDFFVHRDSIRRLQELTGKTTEFLVVNPDYTGYRYNGTVSIAQSDATSGDPLKGTMKIIPSEDLGFIDDCFDLLQQTAKFSSPIEPTRVLKKSEKYEVTIETDPADATVTAESDASGCASATVTGKKLMVTGVAAGSAVISLKAAKDGCASWVTTIHVIVEEDAA